VTTAYYYILIQPDSDQVDIASVAMVISEQIESRQRIVNVCVFDSRTKSVSDISVNYKHLYLLEKINMISTIENEKKHETDPQSPSISSSSMPPIENKKKQDADPPLPPSSSSSSSMPPTINNILQTAHEQINQYRQLNIQMDTNLPTKCLCVVKVCVVCIYFSFSMYISIGTKNTAFTNQVI